jgi:hypothetical protein
MRLGGRDVGRGGWWGLARDQVRVDGLGAGG